MFFFFQAEDGIRDLVRSRGLGDVYKRQIHKEADHKFPVFGVTIEQAGPDPQAQCSLCHHTDLSLIHI